MYFQLILHIFLIFPLYCISFLLLNTKLHKLNGLKQSLLLTLLSVHQESGHGLGGSSASDSHKAAVQVLAVAVVLSEAQVGKDLLPGSHGCWWISVPYMLSNWGLQFLVGYQPEVAFSFLPEWLSPTWYLIFSKPTVEKSLFQQDRCYNFM